MWKAYTSLDISNTIVNIAVLRLKARIVYVIMYQKFIEVENKVAKCPPLKWSTLVFLHYLYFAQPQNELRVEIMNISMQLPPWSDNTLPQNCSNIRIGKF